MEEHCKEHKAQQMHTAKSMEEPPVKKNKSTITYVTLGLMVILLIFAGVQSFQISSLEKTVFSGTVIAGKTTAATRTAPSASRAPAMVGGC